MVVSKAITMRQEGFASILCTHQSSLNIIAITERITEGMGIGIAKIALPVAFSLVERNIRSQ